MIKSLGCIKQDNQDFSLDDDEIDFLNTLVEGINFDENDENYLDFSQLDPFSIKKESGIVKTSDTSKKYNIEFTKNLLNYFSSSELEYIRYDSGEYINYFNKYRADKLYSAIYEKKREKYGMNSLKLDPGAVLSPEKEIIYGYLKKEGYL